MAARQVLELADRSGRGGADRARGPGRRGELHGAGVIVKVPLESGWLSGRYDASSTFSDVRSRWSADDVALRAGLVDELRALLPSGVSLVHAAVQFLLANHGVSTVIPGTRSIEHLETSIASAAEPLPTETVEAIRAWYADRLGDQHLDW